MAATHRAETFLCRRMAVPQFEAAVTDESGGFKNTKMARIKP